MLGAFQAIYPRTRLAYSYKTNYLPRFIQHAHALGAYSEVVSRYEFDFSSELAIPGDRIIFNGPLKRQADLLRALRAGARVNADSLSELADIIGLADALEQPVSIGIRCWLGSATPGSHFGVDLHAAEAAPVLAALDRSPKLRLAGLHCHYSGDRAVSRHRERVLAMIQLHEALFDSRPLDYIDLGGGFTGNMSPEMAQLLPEPPATYGDYAEAIAGEMLAAYGHDGPELILEPGMGLLGDCMVFITRVEAVKQIGARRVAVVDGSMLNVKPGRGTINLPVAVTSPRCASHTKEVWDVVGHTCMDIDILHRGYEGRIEVGDYVLVENTGAYTNVLNAPFIRGTPPIIELGDSGPEQLLRRESTVHDLTCAYQPPQ